MPATVPILTAHLFPEISSRLIALLNELSADEWNLPTLSSERRVKDIASHLLDGSLRRLSIQRDNYQPPAGRGQPNAGESLLEFLNRLNAEWEVATRRLSPPVLIDLLERTDPQVAEIFAAWIHLHRQSFRWPGQGNHSR